MAVRAGDRDLVASGHPARALGLVGYHMFVHGLPIEIIEEDLRLRVSVPQTAALEVDP